MVVVQEEKTPISDLYYGLHVNEAFKIIKDTSEDQFCETELLKEACNQTVQIINDFVKKIETYEKKAVKENAAASFRERLMRGHENE